MRSVLTAFCLLCLLAATALAAEVQVQVDRRQLALGETLRLVVSIPGGDVELPEMPDFDVLGRSSSTNIQMGSGGFSKTTTYLYQLRPKRVGDLTIPAIEVRDGDEISRGEPIPIRVTQAPTVEEGGGDFFITAELAEPEPYVGEPTALTIRVFLGDRLYNAEFSDPEISGFNVEKLDQADPVQTTVKGRRYQVHTINFLLTPLTAGERSIGPATLRGDRPAPGSRRGSSPFDRFFNDPFFSGGNMRPVTVSSEPLTVRVKALPPYAGPGAFTGLVGKFSLSAEPARLAVKAAESATLTVTLEGRGNLADASRPELTAPEGVKVYSDQAEEGLRPTPLGHLGRKIWRYALVPLAGGRYEFGPLSMVTFDPEAGTYKELKTDPIVLEAEGAPASQTAGQPVGLASQSGQTLQPGPTGQPGQAMQASPSAAPGATAPLSAQSTQPIKLEGRDVLPLKEGAEALRDRSPLPWGWFWALAALPFLVFAASWLLASRAGREIDPGRRMSSRCKEALAEASRADEPLEALAALRRALVAAIQAKRGVAGQSLTLAEAREGLAAAGVTEEKAHRAATLLERLDALRYSGAEPGAATLAGLLDEVRSVARSLGA